MTDASDLEGLDPYGLMDAETARLDRFYRGLGRDRWSAPSRCAGWSTRDVLAHLLASEGYNRACLDGTVQQLLAELGERGATDLATANELGIRDLDAVPDGELLDRWRRASAENRRGLRARDGTDIDTSVGPYPARWQAFHLSFELATHADDVGVPVERGEAHQRIAWQARFGRFALKETNPELRISAGDGTTRVQGDGVDVELPDEQLVQAVAARLPADAGLDDAARAVLSVTP